MTISKLYNWTSGTTISSSQVTNEFMQLINNSNDLETTIGSNDTNLRNIAQLSKITANDGTPKLAINNTALNLLNELANLGVGLHTFYCISGAVNNPANNKPIRGIFHQTGAGFGWVYAQDSNGDSYENYYDNNVWKGWKAKQTILWNGTPVYLQGNQTVTPSKKLSQTNNGWILVWSDIDTGNVINDFDWTYIYIPKFMGANHNSQNHLWAIPQTPSNVIVKRGNVYDDKIVGHDDNIANNGNDVVLRYVLEW